MRRVADGRSVPLAGRRWVVAVVGVYVFGLALAAVITRGAFDRFDDRTTVGVGRWVASHPAIGDVAEVLTNFGAPVVLVAVVLLAAAWMEHRGDRRGAITLMLIGGLGALVETALKLTVARARPELDALAYARGYSFPSGHAMNSMIVLVATAWLLAGRAETSTDGPTRPPRRVFLAVGGALTAAILVGSSRVLLGVHHPGDVAAGWALALLWLTLVPTGGRAQAEPTVTAQAVVDGPDRYGDLK